jgi:hypothetical protein
MRLKSEAPPPLWGSAPGPDRGAVLPDPTPDPKPTRVTAHNLTQRAPIGSGSNFAPVSASSNQLALACLHATFRG